MANGSGDIKGSKTGLGIPNWFLELSGREGPKIAAEGTKTDVPSSGYHNDRPPRPSADGFTHSGLWKCDSAVPDRVFPDQQLVTDAFNGLPQEIRSSALGKETEEKLQNSITTGDEKSFEEAKREIEIFLFYYDYEVNVRQAAQRAVLEHFPHGFPASQINFEFFVNVPNGLYDHEELARSALVSEFRGLPDEKRAALYAILFALKSPGFTDDSLLENPLLPDGLQVTHAKYHELNRWVEERRGAFKAAELDGFLEKVKKAEEKETQKDLLLNDSARERLEIGHAVQQLALLKMLEGHDNAETRAFLAAALTSHDNYLKEQGSARSEIEAAVTSPAQDVASIFVSEAHASEGMSLQGAGAARQYPEHSEFWGSPRPFGARNDIHSAVETDRAIVRAALEKLAGDEELDPAVMGLAISFKKAEIKARLMGLALQAGNAHVGGRLIDPVSETESLDLNGDGLSVQKILGDIDMASLANGIDDSIKAVIEQEKLVVSMAGKEDADKEWLEKRYQKLRENYTAARRLLDEGKTKEARSRFLTLSNSPFARSVNKEFSDSLERSESIKFAGRIGIIVAAGAVSSLTAGAAAPWLAATFDLSAGQLAAANLFISSAAFMGAEKILSSAALNELPYNPAAGTWENAGSLTIEYLETVGMFKFLGMGNKAYAQFVERTIFRRAESQLVKEGMVKWGEVYTSEAARALMLKRAELGIAEKILNAGGAFGAEYVSFSAWDLIAAAGHYIAGDGSIDPTAVMSPEAMEERGIFLFCLKLAGIIAMPVTGPLHEVAARKMLAKYRPQLWELARDQEAVLKRLSEYKKSGRKDAGELKDIFKQLKALVKKRERLQAALVQSGMATVDQLAFTRSAGKDAESLEPKLKLLRGLARLVTPKKANEWEYKTENRDEVREIVARLITDHNAEMTEDKGVYKIRLSPEETLEIGPEGARTVHDGAPRQGSGQAKSDGAISKIVKPDPIASGSGGAAGRPYIPRRSEDPAADAEFLGGNFGAGLRARQRVAEARIAMAAGREFHAGASMPTTHANSNGGGRNDAPVVIKAAADGLKAEGGHPRVSLLTRKNGTEEMIVTVKNGGSAPEGKVIIRGGRGGGFYLEAVAGTVKIRDTGGRVADVMIGSANSIALEGGETIIIGSIEIPFNPKAGAEKIVADMEELLRYSNMVDDEPGGRLRRNTVKFHTMLRILAGDLLILQRNGSASQTVMDRAYEAVSRSGFVPEELGLSGSPALQEKLRARRTALALDSINFFTGAGFSVDPNKVETIITEGTTADFVTMVGAIFDKKLDASRLTAGQVRRLIDIAIASGHDGMPSGVTQIIFRNKLYMELPQDYIARLAVEYAEPAMLAAALKRLDSPSADVLMERVRTSAPNAAAGITYALNEWLHGYAGEIGEKLPLVLGSADPKMVYGMITKEYDKAQRVIEIAGRYGLDVKAGREAFTKTMMECVRHGIGFGNDGLVLIGGLPDVYNEYNGMDLSRLRVIVDHLAGKNAWQEVSDELSGMRANGLYHNGYGGGESLAVRAEADFVPAGTKRLDLPGPKKGAANRMIHGFKGYIPAGNVAEDKIDGRLYITIDPRRYGELAGAVTDALQDAMTTGTAAGRFYFKVYPHARDGRYATRRDQIVIYFNSANGAEVVSAVSAEMARLSARDPDMFSEKGPYFTQKLCKGLFFGEEPVIDSESFGSIRAMALEWTRNEIKRLEASGRRVAPGERAMIAAHFFKQLRLDPENPAFNADGRARFPYIFSSWTEGPTREVR